MIPSETIFSNEYMVLKVFLWCGFCIVAVVIFMTSAYLGWEKLGVAKLDSRASLIWLAGFRLDSGGKARLPSSIQWT